MQKRPQADIDYENESIAVAELIDQLTDKLEEHAERQRLEPRDYGYAGSLGHVKAQLINIIEFLG